MKLTVLFLTVGLLNVSANGLSQYVSYSAKNIPLEKVFAHVKQQTGYAFFYEEEAIAGIKPVTINAEHVQLPDFLNMLFKNQPLQYRIESKTIYITRKPTGFGSSNNKPEMDEGLALLMPYALIDVRGRVVNEKGEPAVVSVQVKGTNQGTTSNTNGDFELKGVDENATLVFSGVNVETQEVKVNGRSNLTTITLKMKISANEEVVVIANTGYQTISRERATGSFDVIGRDVLDRRPVANISTALQGTVAGLQAKENPDGSMEFLIRGTSSIYASKQPLIVVDGFPVSDNFSSINPNDVESVTFLKDAAAASIWGARAANGVIVVTTKRPKAGRDRVTVEANVFTRVSDMIDLDQVMNKASSSDHVRYEKLAYDREISFEMYFPAFTNIRSSLTLAQEFMFANRYGGYSTAMMNASLDSLSKIDNRGQLRDHFLRRGILNQATINLSAVTGRARTYGSILYEGRKDGIAGRGYDRYLMNFNNQYDATKFLQFNFGANVQYRKTDMSGPTIEEMHDLSPYETLLNPDGSYSANIRYYNREQLAALPLNLFPYSDWSYNLLREVRGREVTSEQLSIRAQAGLTLKLLKGLNLESSFQYERVKTDNANYQGPETFYARNIANTYVEYNNATRVVGRKLIPLGGILRNSSSNLDNYVIRNQLNVNRNIGSDLNLTAIVGNEVSSYTTTSTTNPWLYGYIREKNQTTLPPYGYGSSVDQFFDFQGFNTTLDGGNTILDWGRDKFVSFYGNAALTFRGKYVLSGSARSDASNYITDDPSLRWSPLWSVGGLWRMSEESFMRKMSFIDNLSVRFTYGKNGNAYKNTSTKPLLNVSASPSTTTGTITATIQDNGNPSLRWERTATTNLGFDFSLFKRKLFGKIDLYNKLGEDITGNIVLPSTTGTTSQRFNNAEILNRGIEVELGTNLRLGKVQWNTTVTYAYNHNNVNNLYYPSYLVRDLTNTDIPVEGRPIGSVYAYTYAGMIDSVPHVVGPKGTTLSFNTSASARLASDFLTYKGTIVPPHTLGWINSFSAFGFDLMVVIVGKMGGVYREPTFNYSAAAIGEEKTSVNRFVRDVFNKDPNIPDFPRYQEMLSYMWNNSYVPNLSGLVASSSYLECKEINLQYNLPSGIVNRLQLSGIRIFAQARDLGMIWHANDKGFHPEWLPGTQRPVTSYTFGINAKF